MNRLVLSSVALSAALLSSVPGRAWAQFMEETPPTPAPRPQPWVAPPAPTPAPTPPVSKPSTPPSPSTPAPRPATPSLPPTGAATPWSPPSSAASPSTPVTPATPTPSTPPRPATLTPSPAPSGLSLRAAPVRSFARTPLEDDDDPKSGKGKASTVEPEGHPAPFMKIGYRRLQLQNYETNGEPFAVNAFELDLYPISREWLRVGTELQIGAASGQLPMENKSSTNWYTVAGYSLGFQYPWRVTPFLDFRFAAGLVGGDVAGKTAISWTWQVGMEGGIELYIVDRTFVSLAFGWVHPSYRGFDSAKLAANPTKDPEYLDFAIDTYTFKISLGL